MRARTEEESIRDFTMQWRAEIPLNEYQAITNTKVDTGQTGGGAIYGAPANGTLRLLVDDITTSIPPLPPHEQAAMEDLRSVERGIGAPQYLWDPNDHPCVWGGEEPGVHPVCCWSNDADDRP